MVIFPAIDLRGGKAVRLVEGDFKQETVYGEDPAKVAETFAAAGATFLHVVDLDGARAGESRNLAVIQRILGVSASMQVEVGGGIRNCDTAARLLEMGVKRVILGSLPIRDPEETERICKKFPGQVVAGIDARNGETVIEGWDVSGGVHYLELGRRMASIGIEHIIFTDIARDGKLTGVNVEATAELARTAGVKVIASGGVSSLADIRALMEHENEGIEGVIIGKALYAGKIDLKEALALVRRAK